MIEKLNERIVIQMDSVAMDQYGNRIPQWVDYYACSAYANTYVKEEDDESVTTTDERSIRFEVRYCSELRNITSTGYRVLFHGEAYNIESVDMMNWQKKMVHLKCRKEKRQ